MGRKKPKDVTLTYAPESATRLIIKGGRVLRGVVKPSGAKNAALPIMFSTLLCRGKQELYNIPDLRDIWTTIELLRHLGLEARMEEGRVTIEHDDLKNDKAPYELVRTMRASILVLGPLLARYGRAKVSMPGGCSIGVRPIDLHLKGLASMGADIEIKHGYIVGKAKRLKGTHIYLDFPTVTGTENLIMAASLAKGVTVIENSAREPEVCDLARSLVERGAKIDGIGTGRIEVEGVDELYPSPYTVMIDRIEAGTFCIAGGITGGEVFIDGIPAGILDSVLHKLDEAGMEIHTNDSGVVVKAGRKILPVDIETRPYPNFPTDMQAQMTSLLSLADGTSTITETIFENRFMHVSELNRMGADITLKGNSAIIRGVRSLTGATVMATDLRASASLIIAGLAAEGWTEVLRIYHLDRGYERIEEKLKLLGADIERVKEDRDRGE